jgi:hypothetical protein
MYSTNSSFYFTYLKLFPFVTVNISLHSLQHCVLSNITSRHRVNCNCLNANYRVLMLEAYGSVDQVMDYYGNTSAPGGHFPFNFRFITDVHYPSSAEDISRTINEYLDRMTDSRTPNWVVRTYSVSMSVLFRMQDSRGH